ncbi:MAG TPA: S46 family peptidase [Blastocatellia bacterium]
MWTFDNPPLKQLKERYGFTPTQEWLDHVRLSSVRFNDGGSGSFISPNGLVLTNHHVARDQLQKISTPQKDYIKDGFYARTQAEEIKSADLELNVLISMEDVTRKVAGAVTSGMTEEKALAARKSEIAGIQDESLKATGLRSDVISLYDGGQYWLYRYKKYTDVRLVFAPEAQTAFFGGDPDNFTYPRYDLDIALFRVYENDKPIHSDQYFKWNSKGPSAGDLVFVSGNPGSTDRLDTMAELEAQRDHGYPALIASVKSRLAVIDQYSSGGQEQARQAADLKFELENALKALSGEYQGLRDKSVIAKKQAEETEFRAKVDQDPNLKSKYGAAWSTIEAAVHKSSDRFKINFYRSVGRSFSQLVSDAVTIVDYVAEIKKPDGERINGFHDSELASTQFALFSPAPVYPNLEELLLADSFKESLGELGPADPFVKAELNGASPDDAAKGLIGGTKLGDPAVRKALVEGGQQAVDASTDPLIRMALRVDPIIREMTKWNEDNVQGVEAAASEEIAKARFAVYGTTAYPDATFTLRLSYGTVIGYPMNGTIAPPMTTFYGLYDRGYSFGLKPPFDIPSRWMDRRQSLDLTVPLDFVSTCDIIGGNSGSPVINRAGEFVGIIFDGNIESLVGRFVYDERTNRAVAVDSTAIIYSLRKVYEAGPLADELEGGQAPAAGSSR